MRLFNRYRELAGLRAREDLMPLTLGVLRRTWVMNLFGGGVGPHALTAWMGLSKLETTRLYYKSRKSLEQAEELKVLERLALALEFNVRQS